MKYPKVLKVKPDDDYKLIITFDSGEIKEFDVKPYIKGEWFGKLSNRVVFSTVKPCGNTVEWCDGQDIAPHELYELSKLIGIDENIKSA
ncbi:DUF2442 domain-containing protein [uncultured Thomasclavelia sp.]|uniref:DUF2442 domain-containing protein n=1 Tax=uncultured Thomasclavelia sp. TaxID=3025759 RepID=UPI00280A8E39|nr:DUF2442 domain-containing protein [uncultured Thomasclavelia sp.]